MSFPPDGHGAAAPGLTIRVVLPHHLKTLSGVDGEVLATVKGAATLRSVLDALEGRYPMLRGTIRDHVTQERRPMVRFFAHQQDITHQSQDHALPNVVVSGIEPLIIIGAIAGG